ncbi:COP9 signalosome complex subunit 8 [Sparganum proliferum]
MVEDLKLCADDNVVLEQHIRELEAFELTMDPNNFSPAGDLSTPGEFYMQLLCLYLRQLDLMNAKFLWKRIPSAIKANDTNLKTIWELAVLLLKKQYPQCLSLAQTLLSHPDLPANMRHHVESIFISLRAYILDLVCSAFSTISLTKLSDLLRSSPEDSASLLTARGWSLSPNGLYLHAPESAHSVTATKPDSTLSNAELMSRLTEFMGQYIITFRLCILFQKSLEEVSLPPAPVTVSARPPLTDPDLPLQCPKCPFLADNSISFRQHGWSAHVLRRGRSGGSKFRSCLFLCPHCLAATTDLTRLEQHFASCHVLAEPSQSQARVLINWVELEVGDEQDAHDDDDRDDICSEGGDDDQKMTEQEGGDDSHKGPHIAPPARQPPSSKPAPPSASPNHLGSGTATCNAVKTPIVHPVVPDAVSSSSTVSPTAASAANVTTATPSNLLLSSANSGASSGLLVEGQYMTKDWNKLIVRSEKKFMCQACRKSLYNGRTEVVFHVVTRHLLGHEVETELSQQGRLSTPTKRAIGNLFADGMRIRSGVHYKDAERVEAALFRSVELHLRRKNPVPPATGPTVYICSDCGVTFTDAQLAYAHINDELRAFLPEFMRTRSCPWSLSSREEWVWCVPDLPLPSPPSTAVVDDTTGAGLFSPRPPTGLSSKEEQMEFMGSVDLGPVDEGLESRESHFPVKFASLTNNTQQQGGAGDVSNKPRPIPWTRSDP